MLCCLLLFIALADADPLGVNSNVTFDEVGGLDDRMFCASIFHCLSRLIRKYGVRYQLVEGDDPSSVAVP